MNKRMTLRGLGWGVAGNVALLSCSASIVKLCASKSDNGEIPV